MRRIALVLAATVAALVLLFSYRTSRGPADLTTAPVPPPAATPPRTPTPTTDGSAGPPARGPVTGTVDGDLVHTARGPVQVRVTLVDGRITEVAVVVRPTGEPHHDVVNGFALPQLRTQALDAQSADIDGVSGATSTSYGYRTSLQSALDRAYGR